MHFLANTVYRCIGSAIRVYRRRPKFSNGTECHTRYDCDFERTIKCFKLARAYTETPRNKPTDNVAADELDGIFFYFYSLLSSHSFTVAVRHVR